MQGRGQLRREGTGPCTWIAAAVRSRGHHQVWTGDGSIAFADVLGRVSGGKARQ